MLEHSLEILVVGTPDTATATARGYVSLQRGHQTGQARPEIAFVEGRGQQAYAARDIETDATGRDDSSTLYVCCGHAADRKAITPMHVRHREAGPYDAWKAGDVLHLRQRTISEGRREQGFGREHDDLYPHFPVARQNPAMRRLTDQVHGRKGLLPSRGTHNH